MRKKESDSSSSASESKSSRFSIGSFFYRRYSTQSRPSLSFSRKRNADNYEVKNADSNSLNVGNVSLTTAASTSGSLSSRSLQDCPLCLAQKPTDDFVTVMTCHHQSCRDCLRQYLIIEINESRVNIACPECNERFHPNDIRVILDSDVMMKKYEEFMLRRVLVGDPDTRWCPAPDCGYAVIATGCASCPKLTCEREGCDTHFCYHCKAIWHPNQTCDAARAERSTIFRSSFSGRASNQGDVKLCPRCSVLIMKIEDGSCNHMNCVACGAEFCWLCMKEISDLHYLSPSGCTFWGKKPWSRKKKILWQLGTLVGAPVGIGLVAGIAIPAMIIGIPVWVGKKLHGRYGHMKKHRRNLLVTGGVSASILVAPVLAGLTVGIGVPILLAYVYGVVPISLCRAGGCGVTTNSSGVRFDFDDEEAAAGGGIGGTTTYKFSDSADSHSVDTAASRPVANPSLGPSIGEMSLGLTNSLSASGSHLDRARDESDRESASNRTVAGSTLNGSIAGASNFQMRLEVQAELAPHLSDMKRSSLSSESATLSMDARSATISVGDNVSTRALAGSLCARDKDGASLSSVPAADIPEEVTSPAADGDVITPNNGTEAIAGGAARILPRLADSRESTPGSEPCAPRGSRPDSPISGRSVNFSTEDEIITPGGARGRHKRRSLSTGEIINEGVERAASIRSLEPVDPLPEVEAGRPVTLYLTFLTSASSSSSSESTHSQSACLLSPKERSPVTDSVEDLK